MSWRGITAVRSISYAVTEPALWAGASQVRENAVVHNLGGQVRWGQVSKGIGDFHLGLVGSLALVLAPQGLDHVGVAGAGFSR